MSTNLLVLAKLLMSKYKITGHQREREGGRETLRETKTDRDTERELRTHRERVFFFFFLLYRISPEGKCIIKARETYD